MLLLRKRLHESCYVHRDHMKSINDTRINEDAIRKKVGGGDGRVDSTEEVVYKCVAHCRAV